MRTRKNILLLMAALMACACLGIHEPEEPFSGPGSIVLTLSSQDDITLETKTPAEDLAGGLSFRNVLVILTDNSNIVVGKEYIEEEEVAGVVTPVNTKTITFDDLNPGDYIAYAYANIDRTQWQKSNESGERLSTYYSGISIGDNFSTYLNRELASLTAAGTDVPGAAGEAMLLTGKQPIEVNLTVVPATLHLLRPVVRFNVIIDNSTDYDVRVDALSFSHFNPDKAFIIQHTDGNGHPALPNGATYRGMPAFSGPVTVEDGSQQTVYSQYVYENSSPNPYKIFASLTLLRSNNPSDYLELALGERPFGPINFATLDAMDEGESVDVLLFNPQRNVRSGRLFCYLSSENRMVWESSGYQQYDKLFGRAQAIYQEKTGVDAYNYNSEGGYTYTNANGYSSWDGINAHDGNTGNTFDYAGARSTYFHTITKSGGLYSISGLAVGNGVVSDSSIDNLTLSIGNPTGTPLNKVTEGVKPYLVRFLNSQGKALVAEANYSANTPNKVSYLRFDTASENQDRQFLLFGKYCSGGLLNRLLSGSNREEELTYMSRNEDINVTISVFYADQDGTLTFRVDNGEWTSNIITASHIFY